jgi:hypothetical protein
MLRGPKLTCAPPEEKQIERVGEVGIQNIPEVAYFAIIKIAGTSLPPSLLLSLFLSPSL